jgi:hypothetical protein
MHYKKFYVNLEAFCTTTNKTTVETKVSFFSFLTSELELIALAAFNQRERTPRDYHYE